MKTLVAIAASLLIAPTAFAASPTMSNTRASSASGSSSTAVVYNVPGDGSSSAASSAASSGSTAWRPAASSALGPSLFPSNQCMGIVSAGGSGYAFGFSVGSTYQDKQCEVRSNAAALYALGLRAAAAQELCSIDSVKEALAAAGRPCAGFKEAESVTHVAVVAPAPVAAPPVSPMCRGLDPRNREDRPYWTAYHCAQFQQLGQ